MRDEWYPHLKLPISWEQFHQLPQNAAYKYEYFNKTAWLSPRPKYYSAMLTLQPVEPVCEVDAQWMIGVRPLRDADWERLAKPFSGAFHRVVPFSGMEDEARLQAARECLEKTRSGGDGPIIEDACFVAVDANNEDRSVGAILITLVPDKDPSSFGGSCWKQPPPADAVAKRLGRAHVTWIFVAPLVAGHGVGTALLSNAAPKLLELGYTELSTTFHSGNASSMLWHWRNGFRLLEYAGSSRRMMRTIRRQRERDNAATEE